MLALILFVLVCSYHVRAFSAVAVLVLLTNGIDEIYPSLYPVVYPFQFFFLYCRIFQCLLSTFYFVQVVGSWLDT